jgi:hypothetical protein
MKSKCLGFHFSQAFSPASTYTSDSECAIWPSAVSSPLIIIFKNNICEVTSKMCQVNSFENIIFCSCLGKHEYPRALRAGCLRAKQAAINAEDLRAPSCNFYALVMSIIFVFQTSMVV